MSHYRRSWPSINRRTFFKEAAGQDIGAGSLTFVENAVGSYERAVLSTIPDGFGDGEFTLELFFKCLVNGTYALGDINTNGTSSSLPQRQLWSSYNPAKYASFDSTYGEWWYHGNFLIDGHNNTSGRLDEGTFSLQIAAGRPRWTFSDGTAAVDALNGDMYGVQSTATNTVLDNEWHHVHLVRRWSGASDADLELWLDGTLQDSVTIPNRVNMATNFWDSWTNYPTGEQNWMFGTEKQAARGVLVNWEDFKGQLGQIRFWSRALSTGECGNAFNVIAGNETGLVEYYNFSEQSGSTVAGALGGGAYDMTLVNSPAWSTDRPTT